jgi:hypothetical protein
MDFIEEILNDGIRDCGMKLKFDCPLFCADESKFWEVHTASIRPIWIEIPSDI